MRNIRRRLLRATAVFMAFNIFIETAAPSVAYALTNGPSSPEFSSFEPVATTDMVSLFSGDFTYNLPVLDIPGPDGAGYSLSLSYHSGTSPEEEASWVGYGWTLNPGAINRNTRGFPDDYSDVQVEYYNKTRPNWSAGSTDDIGLEVFSKDASSIVGISASTSLRFNNYQGYQRSKGLGLSLMGMVNIGANFSAEGITYSANVSPLGILSKINDSKSSSQPETASKDAQNFKLHTNFKSGPLLKRLNSAVSSGLGSAYGIFNFNEFSRATGMTKYTGTSVNYSKSVQINGPVPVGLQLGSAGNFNLQFSEKQTTKKAYGYMNNIVEAGEKQLTDYYVEKGNSYSKRDYFLGIPFNNADNFSVTGEGLSGGFRFYPYETGHFYPEKMQSKTRMLQAGIEFMAGLNLGIGVDIGIGSQKLEMQNWPSKGNTSDWTYNGKGGIFRFNNDLGGEIEYSNNNDAETGRVTGVVAFPGFGFAKVDMPSSITKNANGNNNNNESGSAISASMGRSSYIDYRTNAQLSSSSQNAFNKTANIGDLVYRNSPPAGLGNGVAEISVHNEEGNQYIYGLPTYVKNEANLQFNINNASIVDNYIAFQDAAFSGDLNTPNLSAHETVVGEVRKVPYATNYLLTQILTSDYADIGSPGISDDDFGGWTQFTYHKAYGSNINDWYRYRTPYTGLMYQKNSISDTKDDVGTMMSGEKEVYYLKTIETKTHIAFFVTNYSSPERFPGDYNANYLEGSGETRLDGKGASKELTGGLERSARNSNAQGTEELEYLEKIVLFSKARPDKPIKITRFAYSYDLVGNLPNNINGRFPDSKASLASGKLTLEKVWFEYEGVINSRISPYIFKYEYKDADELTSNNEGHLLSRHPYFAALLGKYTKESQNPDYNPHLLDAWGNIQNFGREQQMKDRPWIYQGPDNTPGAKRFDPAAWQLKQIKLPSGGEILVEYEQRDYRFVQNRPSMAMASLAGVNDRIEDGYTNPSYVVNTSDLNVTTVEERDLLIQKILDYYGQDREKIYFKFLYALKGNVAQLDFCKSDYVDGYAKLLSVVPEGNSLNIRITLEGKTVSGTSGQRYNSPRQACYDLVANQRLGKVDDVSDNCLTALEQQFDDFMNLIAEGQVDDKAIKLGLVPDLIGRVHDDLHSSKYQIPDKGSVCKTINAGLSYLKLPMVHAKKGGGIRVKRLYMLDHGLETGDAALYGSEYIYETEDGLSSGVATNEPGTMRPENPLVTFLPKKSQSWYSKITAGEEKDQTEGPIGESLLPGASVGHSRVVVKNIHEGPTGTGFSIHEYFTVKDYPFDKIYSDVLADTEIAGKGVDHTNLDNERVTDHVNIPAVFFTYSVDKVWAAQGFRFVVNNMHGQVKRMETHGGDYADYAAKRTYLVSSQSYEYFEPGEKVKVLKPNGTYSLETPGKEMDISMEMKSLYDNTMSFSLEMDISINVLPPWPVFFNLWPSFELRDSRISTHSTSKVLRYPAIVKSVTSFKDGAFHKSENLAFNQTNGQPILVKATDGFDGVIIGGEKHDGSIYTLSVPASWKYGTMGQKSQNANNTNQLGAITGTFVTYGAEGNLINTDNQTWNPNISASNNVLSAQVQTFNNSAAYTSWFSSDVQARYPGLNVAANRTKLGRVWRPFETYTYRTDATSSNNADAGEDKIYSGGFFRNFSMFNWGTSSQSDANWIKLNQITKYSPHGSALEERNVLGIYSAVKYDYSFGNSNNLLPVIMTTNGQHNTIAFDSYETSGTGNIGHSGSNSLLYSSPSTVLLSGLSVTNQLLNKGGIVKLWLKSTHPSGPISPEAVISGRRVRMDKVAKTGEWTLFSAAIDKSNFPGINTAFTVSASYALRSGETVYIDDARFQPMDASSKCFVYDLLTFKLLTQFDDQHFGLYYQYNSEGKLIRKQIETEKGLKTIQETQYNTPKNIPLQ